MNNLTYLKAFVDNERLKNPSIKIVATNGCFDVLHYGHLQMLKTAKSFGDILIVGLNSDESIKILKGFTKRHALEEYAKLNNKRVIYI